MGSVSVAGELAGGIDLHPMAKSNIAVNIACKNRAYIFLFLLPTSRVTVAPLAARKVEPVVRCYYHFFKVNRQIRPAREHRAGVGELDAGNLFLHLLGYAGGAGQSSCIEPERLASALLT